MELTGLLKDAPVYGAGLDKGQMMMEVPVRFSHCGSVLCDALRAEAEDGADVGFECPADPAEAFIGSTRSILGKDDMPLCGQERCQDGVSRMVANQCFEGGDVADGEFLYVFFELGGDVSSYQRISPVEEISTELAVWELEAMTQPGEVTLKRFVWEDWVLESQHP